MERLKQAMDRARAERAARLGNQVVSVSRGEPTRLHPLKRGEETPPRDVRVDYTRTATIPVDREALRERRILLEEDQDPASASYKVLRTHVLQRMRTNRWKTLAITSPSLGNGKTVTAINLAISLAREVNQTVLLVDLDLKRPSIGSYFADGPTKGISDYVTKDAELADLLIHPGIERLVVLPGNESFAHSSEILSSPRMTQLVDELKSRYEDRLIIFDMPPVLASDDVIAFLPYLDTVMLVVEDGVVTREELERAQQALGDKLMGVMVNKSNESSVNAGSYY